MFEGPCIDTAQVMFDSLQQRHDDSVANNSGKLTVYLLECSIYILKYVVAAVVRCGDWQEVDTSVHATEGVLSLLMLHSCSVSP